MTNGKQPKPFSQAYEYFDNKVFKKEGYCDYHNHLGGVLPYQKLYEFYVKHYNKTMHEYNNKECKDLSVDTSKKNFKKFKSPVGLFLRTTYHLLKEKYKFKTRDVEPLRGAHAAMLSVFYIFSFAMQAKLINASTKPDDLLRIKQPKEILDHLLSVIKKCYEFYGKNDVPKVCESIAKKAFRNYVRAMRYSPFDDGYVGRGAFLKMFDKNTAKNTYGKTSLDWLKENEQIKYVEMSQPPDKIPDFAGSKEYSWCKWLLLTAKHRANLAGMGSDAWSGNGGIKECIDHLHKTDTYIGIDLAGPEGYEYKEAQTNALVKQTLVAMQEKAVKVKRNLVFRPHVGEGSSIFGKPEKGMSLIEKDPVYFLNKAWEGASGLQDYINQKKSIKGITTLFFEWLGQIKVKDGVPIQQFTLHGKLGKTASREIDAVDQRVKEISVNNITAFINALRKAEYPNKFPNVIVRFGHVTHVQQKHAEKMAELGIGADVNLGSNLRTGSITFLGGLVDAQRRSSAFGKWNQDWTSLVDRGHGLMNLLDSSVWVGLGSDGQGAEETGIYYEYHLAEEYLKEHGYQRMILQPKRKMKKKDDGASKSYRNWTEACCHMLQSNALLMQYEPELKYKYRYT